MEKHHYSAENIDAMQQCGGKIANAINLPATVYLHGQLGAGKTTLVKGIAKELGYLDIVSSPSYNLVHQYPTKTANIAHLDLYRLDDSEEIMMLGITDLLDDKSLLLIEWPEKGQGYLPDADVVINISYQKKGNQGRDIDVTISK